ncbi:MAG: head-tail connector protein [Aeromonas veronii]
MQYKIISREDISEDFIPLTELQDHLRMYDPHEDELITTYRSAAIDFAERYMNRAIGIKSVLGSIDVLKNRHQLPFGDVVKLNSVKLLDGTVIDATLHPVTNELLIEAGGQGKRDAIVSFDVGYQVEDIPKAIKIGCMKLISTWYEAREDVSFGVSVQQVPFNHRACFDLYRIPAGA